MPKYQRELDNEAFAQRLNDLLERSGQPRHGAGAYLAKTYKVSTVTANAWLNGTHRPGIQTARRIARDHDTDFDAFYFGVPAKDISEEPPGYDHDVALQYVPLISSATAGNWGEVCDSYQPGDGERPVPTTAKVSRRAFALRVKGDSMEPRIPNGAIVIVDPAAEARPGKMVVVRQNHDAEATVKTLISDGGQMLLKPENPRYPIMQLRDDAVICGVVRQIVMDVD